MTRAEHLQWAKDRAVKYADAGNPVDAYASFISDMKKHDELATHSALDLMTQMVFSGLLSSPGEMRKFINGFH